MLAGEHQGALVLVVSDVWVDVPAVADNCHIGGGMWEERVWMGHQRVTNRSVMWICICSDTERQTRDGRSVGLQTDQTEEQKHKSESGGSRASLTSKSMDHVRANTGKVSGEIGAVFTHVTGERAKRQFP
jgi:hypothetical protein